MDREKRNSVQQRHREKAEARRLDHTLLLHGQVIGRLRRHSPARGCMVERARSLSTATEDAGTHAKMMHGWMDGWTVAPLYMAPLSLGPLHLPAYLQVVAAPRRPQLPPRFFTPPSVALLPPLLPRCTSRSSSWPVSKTLRARQQRLLAPSCTPPPRTAPHGSAPWATASSSYACLTATKASAASSPGRRSGWYMSASL